MASLKCAGEAEGHEINPRAYGVAGTVPSALVHHISLLLRSIEDEVQHYFEPLRKKLLSKNGHAIDCMIHLHFRDVKI